MWGLLVLVVLVVLAALVLVVGRRRPDLTPGDADPLFTAGIAIAGASAALIATLGLAMIPTLIVGLACIVIGARRSHARRP